MNRSLTTLLIGLLLASSLSAEKYTLTNKEGKSIEVELVAIEGENIVIKTANKSIANVPLNSLSDKDQQYLKTWWEKHRNKPQGLDIRISIEKKSDRIDRKVTSSGGNGRGNNNQQQIQPLVKKVTIDEFYFIGNLNNFSRKDIDEIEVDYTIYKRVSISDAKGNTTKVEEINGEDTVRALTAKGRATFETERVQCEDTSQSGGNKSREWKRETILGVTFRLSTASGEFLEYAYPDGFLERLETLE